MAINIGFLAETTQLRSLSVLKKDKILLPYSFCLFQIIQNFYQKMYFSFAILKYCCLNNTAFLIISLSEKSLMLSIRMYPIAF